MAERRGHRAAARRVRCPRRLVRLRTTAASRHGPAAGADPRADRALPVSIECVLCDWVYDPYEAPRFVYRSGGSLPLRWTDTGPTEVRVSDSITETIKFVALMAHWAR